MGIISQILSGGPILLVLFVLSVFSLAFVTLKFFEIRKLRLDEQTPTAENVLRNIEKVGVVDAITEYRSAPSPVAQLISKTIEVCTFENLSLEDREKELSIFARKELKKIEAGMETISTIAHLSPLLGLLGTVVGMIQAFQGLERVGLRADPSVLAGGIWEALLTTALGMIIAIPLIAIHHYFNRKVEETNDKMEEVATRLLNRLQTPSYPTERRLTSVQ